MPSAARAGEQVEHARPGQRRGQVAVLVWLEAALVGQRLEHREDRALDQVGRRPCVARCAQRRPRAVPEITRTASARIARRGPRTRRRCVAQRGVLGRDELGIAAQDAAWPRRAPLRPAAHRPAGPPSARAGRSGARRSSRPGRAGAGRARPAPARWSLSTTTRRRSLASGSGRSVSRMHTDGWPPRPTRPRNWCSWARPKRSAPSISMTVAFGTSTPTSTTAVETSTSNSRSRNARMTASFSAGRMRPCSKPSRSDCQLAGPQALVLLGGRLGLEHLRLLDQRTDDERLLALRRGAAHALVGQVAVVGAEQQRPAGTGGRAASRRSPTGRGRRTG